VGARSVGTDGAKAGVERIRSLLESDGLRVTLDTFRAPLHTLYDGPALIALALLILAAGAFFGPVSWTPAAAFFMALVLIPLVGDLLAIPVNMDMILPKVPAENVEADIVGHGKGRILLIAHHDTQWATFIFSPGFLPFARLFFLLAYAGFFGLFTATAVAGLWRLPWAHAAIAPLGLVLLITIAVLRCAFAGRAPLLGANDNASGVAVATAVALAIRQDVKEGRLAEQGASLSLLLTGAEEVGERGMLHWVRKNHPPRGETAFVNLDNVAGGTLRFLESEGMILPLRSHPSLVRLARATARNWPGELEKGEPLLLPTDAMWPISLGYAAITFIGQEKDGRIPDYHQVTDQPDRIDAVHLARVTDIVHDYVFALWKEASDMSVEVGSRP